MVEIIEWKSQQNYITWYYKSKQRWFPNIRTSSITKHLYQKEKQVRAESETVTRANHVTGRRPVPLSPVSLAGDAPHWLRMSRAVVRHLSLVAFVTRWAGLVRSNFK